MLQTSLTVATLAALSLAAATGTAAAQDQRFYVSLMAGGSLADEQDISGANAAGARRDIDIDFDNGFVVGAALGIKAAEGSWGRFRAEGEVNYRENDLDGLALNGVARTVLEGEESVVGGLVNLWYDTPQYFDRVRLTAGGGIGLAGIDYNIRYLAGANQIAIPTSVTTFAFQLGGGMEIELTDRIALIADARYFALADHDVERFNLTANAIDSVLDSDFDAVTVTGGLRVMF